MLSNDIVFLCGSFSISLPFIQELVQSLYRCGVVHFVFGKASSYYSVEAGFRAVWRITELRRTRKNGQYPLAVYVLQLARYSEAKEPVDRIFGHLGLMSPDYRHEFVIDYTSTARKEYWTLYLTAAKLLIRKEGSLRLLGDAESANRPALLPSWVPDWSNRPPTEPFSPHFHAGWDGRSSIATSGLFIPDSNSIRLRGIRVGVIKAASKLCDTFQKSYDDVGYKEYNSHRLRAITQALDLYRQLPGYQEDEETFARFARTFIADSTYEANAGPWRNDDDVAKGLTCWMEYLTRSDLCPPGSPAPSFDEEYERYARPYTKAQSFGWRNRSFFIAEDGHFGLVSKSSRPGDTIFLPLGATTPLVLRRVEGKDSFVLVCPAYVDGIMYGEALKRDDAHHVVYVID